MLILGVESSCDETGIALYDSDAGLLSHEAKLQKSLHFQANNLVLKMR